MTGGGRRRFLTLTGASVISTLAGCSFGDTSDSPETPEETPTTTLTPTETLTPTTSPTPTPTPTPTKTPSPRLDLRVGSHTQFPTQEPPSIDLGRNVATDGKHLVISNQQANKNEGVVYAYKNSAQGWTRHQKITRTSDPTNPPGLFGRRIALSGDTLLVSSRQGTDTLSRVDKFSFREHAGKWWFDQSFLLDEERSRRPLSPGFGSRILTDGTILYVTDYKINPTYERSTRVYQLEKGKGDSELTNNDWGVTRKYENPNPPKGRSWSDTFGTGLAVDGESLFIGAPKVESDKDWPESAVYVYDSSGRSRLVPSGVTNNDLFGFNIEASDETVLIGAPETDLSTGQSAGACYLFERDHNRGTWSQTAQLVAPDRDQGDNFGYSLALSDDFAVIGALNDEDSGGKWEGSAYLFNRTDGWSVEAKLTAPRLNSESSGFASSIGISGNTVFVGTIGDYTFAYDIVEI